MGIIDDSPTGRLIRNIMLAFSEFERDLIIQRTREGKEIARQNSNYREGRSKKFSLIEKVVRVSVETVRIVEALPKLGI